MAVDIYAYNSKFYYVITDGAGLGDAVVKFPITGNDTVLDALAEVNGMQEVSSKRIWIARPAPAAPPATRFWRSTGTASVNAERRPPTISSCPATGCLSPRSAGRHQQRDRQVRQSVSADVRRHLDGNVHGEGDQVLQQQHGRNRRRQLVLCQSSIDGFRVAGAEPRERRNPVRNGPFRGDAPVRDDRGIAGRQSVFARTASIAASSAPATVCNSS